MPENVKITLQNGIISMLNRLEQAGYEAYTVGGFVRDALLCKDAGDCDITTSALPEDIKRVFADERTVDTGIKHGTVTVLMDGVPYEITTYRVDGEYADNRHPDRVQFTASLEEDLARRDFTVNAMAYSETRGFVDAFGGREDLARGIIRAVGDPTRRFSEDALRILRALRFASVLDFTIEDATRAAVFAEAYRLEKVSVERVLVELRKLLSGRGAYRILSEYGRIISDVLSLGALSLPEEASFSTMTGAERLISIFYLSSDEPAAAFSQAMRRLHSDRETERFGSLVLETMTSELAGDRLYEAILDYGTDVVSTALSVLSRLGRATDAEARFAELRARGTMATLSELSVGGRELISLGYSGARIGSLLRILAVAVMSGRVENTAVALLEYIKKAPLA